MRLLLVVEGETERNFVDDLLKPHLAPLGVFTSATIVGNVTAQRRGNRHRGGGFFKTWRRDFARILGHDKRADLRVSTLFDLYGLPNDFPQYEACSRVRDANERCEALEAALAEEFGDRRLMPYIQKYEFEALVLASLGALRDCLDDPDITGVDEFQASISATPPEDVNDHVETSPSKRIERYVPAYEKKTHGSLVIEDTGLATVRAKCSRFHSWLTRLEKLADHAEWDA